MNHKLRVLVRVDADPGLVTLEVTGCLTQSDFSSLLHIMRRAGRLGAGTGVFINLHGASHLDQEILLQLRSIADASVAAAGTGAGAPAGSEQVRVTLAEPADLPICLLHGGSGGEVLAGFEGEPATVPPLGPIPAGLNTINGLELAEYSEGTLDPAAIRAGRAIPAEDELAAGQALT